MSKKKLPDNEIVLYTAPGGDVNIDVLFENDNLWLPQRRMAELFDCTADNISLHLKNIYAEHELDETATTEEFSVVQKEGEREVTRTVHFKIQSYQTEAVNSVDNVFAGQALCRAGQLCARPRYCAKALSVDPV